MSNNENCGCNNSQVKEESCGCSTNKIAKESCGCNTKNTEEQGCGCSSKNIEEKDCGCSSKDPIEQGCGCGCSHDDVQELPIMKLQFDNDEEVNCAVLDLFEFESKKYIILLPEDSHEYLVYTYIESEKGAFSLANIESDDEFNKVIDYINSELTNE